MSNTRITDKYRRINIIQTVNNILIYYSILCDTKRSVLFILDTKYNSKINNNTNIIFTKVLKEIIKATKYSAL